MSSTPRNSKSNPLARSGRDQAFALREAAPGSILMGEERGLPPDGFDLGNSPVQFDGVDLDDRVVIQRTTNGTRGLMWVEAPLVLAAAAINASATAAVAGAMPSVHLVCTGTSTSEDRVCAEHIATLLGSCEPDPTETRRRILDADPEHRRHWTRPRSAEEIAAHEADLAACAQVDRYHFAMVAHRSDDHVVLTRHDP